jgi:hypothetical protein
LPPRPADALSGSEVASSVRTLELGAREERLYHEIALGNVPDWIRSFVRIELPRDIDGRTRVATIWVAPDYVAIGSNEDYFLAPLSPQTAQRVADLTGTSLPTTRIVDAVWAGAGVRLGPDSIAPGPAMTTVPVFENHNARVRGRREVHDDLPGALVAGHKKDVVLTSRLVDQPGHVAIYGWHRPDGRPIQPLYLGHTDRWVDYSHGIRLVGRVVLVDGVRHDLVDVVSDPELAIFLSDEGTITEPRYPLAGSN